MWFIPQPDISRISPHTKNTFCFGFRCFAQFARNDNKKGAIWVKKYKTLAEPKTTNWKMYQSTTFYSRWVGENSWLSFESRARTTSSNTFFAKKIAIERKKYAQSHFASLTLIIMESFSIFVFIYSGHFCQFRQNLTCFSLLRRFFFPQRLRPSASFDFVQFLFSILLSVYRSIWFARFRFNPPEIVMVLRLPHAIQSECVRCLLSRTRFGLWFRGV